MRNSLFAACLLLLPSAPAWAQAYAIKFKGEPGVGKSVVIRDADKQSGGFKVRDADGALVKDQVADGSSSEEYVCTVLEGGGKQPKKFKRAYTKAVRREGKGEAKARSYQGRTVLFDLKDGKYVVTAEGAPDLAPADLAELTRKANDRTKDDLDEMLAPKRPVKVGDSWALPEKVVAEFGKVGVLDKEASKGTARLLKAYRKGGQQWGVIEVRLTLALQTMQGIKFDTPATFAITVTLDTAIDGSSTAGKMTVAGKLAGKSAVERGGARYVLEVGLETTGTKERTAEE